MMEQPVPFSELVERHFDALYNYARILTRTSADAENLFQETLVRAFRSSGTFDPQRSMKVWLLKIMKNACRDEFRRARHQPPTEPLREEAKVDDAVGGAGVLPGPPLNPEEIRLRR
jgi:RNA polymerase sigma factor (sigma-70 family)